MKAQSVTTYILQLKEAPSLRAHVSFGPTLSLSTGDFLSLIRSLDSLNYILNSPHLERLPKVLIVSFIYLFFKCISLSALLILVSHLVKNRPAMRETWVWPLGWEDPLERERLPTPVFWPRGFHGLYSPWGHIVLDTNERLSRHITSRQVFSFLSNIFSPWFKILGLAKS